VVVAPLQVHHLHPSSLNDFPMSSQPCVNLTCITYQLWTRLTTFRWLLSLCVVIFLQFIVVSSDRLIAGKHSRNPTSQFPSCSTLVVIAEQFSDGTGPLWYVSNELGLMDTKMWLQWLPESRQHTLLTPAFWPYLTAIYIIYTLHMTLAN